MQQTINNCTEFIQAADARSDHSTLDDTELYNPSFLR